MSFVEHLREELVTAAAREQERTGPRLQLPPLRPLALAAAGIALAAILVIVVAGGLRTDHPPPSQDTTPARQPSGVRDLFGGTLEPDVRYRTRAFEPELTFMVGDRNWYAADTTSPDQVPLVRVTRGRPASGPPDRMLAFVHIREVLDPQSRGLQAARVPAPDSLYAWLRRHPDLRVSPATSVTVAGVPGESFSAVVDFERPAHSDPLCRAQLMRTCTMITPDGSFQNGTHLRIIQLRTEPEPLYIGLSAGTARGLAALERVARPVLESLRIQIR
jgi:hypothetical protein